MMNTVHVVEQHNQVLDLWRAQQESSLSVLHLDFHCDMRGLLIDRCTQRAHRIWDINSAVDQGNFLTHAILEGRVNGIRWVHDEPGGRQYDVGTVKYESDLTALPHRWLMKLRCELGIPIHYDVIKYVNWKSLNNGEYLDVDWDFFACAEYPVDTISNRVESFLDREFHTIPEQTYVCYSPDFSHPSRAQFRHFIENLADIFDAKVVTWPPRCHTPMPSVFYKKYIPPILFRLIRRIYYDLSLSLKARGIY